jgi:hypothetical protein
MRFSASVFPRRVKASGKKERAMPESITLLAKAHEPHRSHLSEYVLS